MPSFGFLTTATDWVFCSADSHGDGELRFTSFETLQLSLSFRDPSTPAMKRILEVLWTSILFSLKLVIQAYVDGFKAEAAQASTPEERKSSEDAQAVWERIKNQILPAIKGCASAADVKNGLTALSQAAASAAEQLQQPVAQLLSFD